MQGRERDKLEMPDTALTAGPHSLRPSERATRDASLMHCAGQCLGGPTYEPAELSR